MSRDRFGFRLACHLAVALAAFLYVLVVNGAIPGLTTPSLGLSLWTSSFSQSFANVSPLAIHATNFGYPGNPAMAFGLSGGLVESWLIGSGLDAPDAYTTMVVLWLMVAFLGACLLARRVGIAWLTAILAATLWLSMPIVWAHAGFGMLSLGIALLPTYFLPLLILLDEPRPAAMLWSLVLAVIAVFMDGYSFMMFATGSLIVCGGAYVARHRDRRHVLLVVLPVQVASLASAYVLYRQYSHYGSYDKAPIEFFRAFGLDLSFVAVPTAGVHWLWDLLGLAKSRSDAWYYGDGSVWGSSFCLPLLLAGFYGAWRSRKNWFALSLIVVALFGLYMSLGPSLKIDTTRPRLPDGTPALASTPDPFLMPSDAAVMNTGSLWLSKKVPGFKLMRASYRWVALGLFACWVLVLLGLPRDRYHRATASFLVIMICLMAPHPIDAFRQSSLHRRLLADIERDVVSPLRNAVRGPVIAFSPFGNDFLGAYIAARLDLRAFNAGGDKNYAMAYAQWPAAMVRLRDPATPGQDIGIIRFLLDGTGDSVIIPYFDLFYSAQIWPCNPAGMTPRVSGAFSSSLPEADCVDSYHRYFASTVRALKTKPYIKIVESHWFAVVTLDDAYRGEAERRRLLSGIVADIRYPIVIAPENAPGSAIQDLLLEDGWYLREQGLVWSRASSVIRLPVPSSCATASCSAVLSFGVFGASDARPVPVHISEIGDAPAWSASVTVTGSSATKMRVPLTSASPSKRFRIEVPNAATPAELGASGDFRRLGIGLLRIDLTHEGD